MAENDATWVRKLAEMAEMMTRKIQLATQQFYNQLLPQQQVIPSKVQRLLGNRTEFRLSCKISPLIGIDYVKTIIDNNLVVILTTSFFILASF